MIFRVNKNNKPDVILIFGKYHPYRLWGHRNHEFDGYSGKILDLKENKPDAVEYFYSLINPHLSNDFAIAIVPSHDPSKTTSGIMTLGQKLAKVNRVDATSCLVRTKEIQKLAQGGPRDPQIHLDSIRLRNQHLIKSREVLLLDDVTTSHNSLRACEKILLDNGAVLVQCCALGETTH